MRIALVLGSAECIGNDVDAAKKICGKFDGTVACNEMIARWSEPLAAAVSLHPEKVPLWLDRRRRSGFPAPKMVVISDRWKDWFSHIGRDRLAFTPDLLTVSLAPGQKGPGSSGLFAVKVALQDLGFDKAVCCGIPMTQSGHVDRPAVPWAGAGKHQAGWMEARDFLQPRVRSMSGWTANLLGIPKKKWLSA